MNKNKISDELLGYQGALNYGAELPVLGIPVRFRSNQESVIKSVHSTLGHWDQLPRDLCSPDIHYDIDIITQDSDCEPPPDQYSFYYRIRGDTFLASYKKNLLTANRSTGQGLAFVTRSLVSDKSAFAWYVIEALALFLATSTHRIPIHASAVTKNDRGIAFIGKSGDGKSSLAYACLKRGFDLLSEDTIYVDTGKNYRIWGNATKVHVMPDMARLFPELKNHKPQLRPNGKIKIALPITEINNCVSVLQTSAITVCVIEPNHQSHDSSLEPVTSEQITEIILSSLEPGLDLYAEMVPAAVKKLLSSQSYRLKVGYDLNATTALLMNLV